ncbi:MAG: Qat anti-phage system ATPase QatA [Janthinobacterium lividum]
MSPGVTPFAAIRIRSMSPISTPLGYLSDNETKVDYLNNEAIASTILRLITAKSDSPITVGVHGDWGAGKSSVLEMIEASLKDDQRTLCLKFNGWQFQGFEDAKIALIEGVLHELSESRSVLTKASDAMVRAWGCLDKLKVLSGVAKLGVAMSTGLPMHVSGIADLVTSVGDRAVDIVSNADDRSGIVEGFDGAVREGAKFGRPSAPTAIAGFRKAFKDVIKKAEIDRLVVLVDDLDRCLPETAVQTLEAIRLFVLMEKTAFVVGADERMIEYAVHRHFPNLPQMEDSQGYARAYLEKLLQVPFRIPALGETETRIYATLMLLGAVIDAPERFDALLGLGRQALRSPWDPDVFGDASIRAALPDISQEESTAIVMAERISPVLAGGTKGNPRQIKRFLNALTLRLAVSDARGFGTAVEPGRLAKIMLAELFLPESVFGHIASSAANSSDGICPELAEIEEVAKLGKAPSLDEEDLVSSDDGVPEPEEVAAPPEPAGKAERNPTVSDWRMRPEVIRWAAVQPDLQGVNLKPYLFVIKDKRNYLATSAPLSPKLRDIVARLATGSANSAKARPLLQGLSPAEVDSVFSALRGQVLAAQTFDTKPVPLVGIGVMAEVFPALGGRYVDLLGDLPAARLNAWATAGHGFLVGPARERYDRLLTRWSASGNARLKRAIEIMRQTPTRSSRKT